MKILSKNKKKKGFTLIELVAVVAIIGILAALLVPKIAGYIEDAKKTKVVDQARQVHMAVQTANTKNDTQIALGDSVDTVLGGGGTYDDVLKYMGLTAATDAATSFPNLDGSMSIQDCKDIVEGADFNITDGVYSGKVTS